MKRALEVVATLGVAGAIVAGSDISQPAAPDNKYSVARDDVPLQEAFDSVRQFWASHAIARAVTMRMVIVEPGETTICHAPNDDAHKRQPDLPVAADYYSPAVYCSTDNTVIVSGMTYRNLLGAMDRKVSPRQVADYTLAHESGHMVQYNEDPNTLGGSSIVEQQADCLGGVALSTIAPADIVVAPEFYSGLDGHGVLGTDLSHGTIQDRINMFRLGATDPVAC